MNKINGISVPDATLEEIKIAAPVRWDPGYVWQREGVAPNIAEWYTARLQVHLECVWRAGVFLGVDRYQLSVHDQSKWSDEEFVPYALKFWHEELHGTDALNPHDERFKRAMLRHQNENKHHWVHWVMIKRGGQLEALEMPECFAMEMVADWMGASMSWTESWDMTGWLSENWNGLTLHPNTRAYVGGILAGLGYDLSFGG